MSRALAHRLRSAHAPLRPYVREALARQRTDEALGVLVDGLLARGIEREQSQRLIVAYGARALPYFDRVLAEHPDAAGTQFFEIAAASRTRVAVEWSLQHLRQGSPARAIAVGRALRRDLMRPWPRSLRRFLRTRVLDLIRAGRFQSRAAVQVVFELLDALGPVAAGSHPK